MKSYEIISNSMKATNIPTDGAEISDEGLSRILLENAHRAIESLL